MGGSLHRLCRGVQNLSAGALTPLPGPGGREMPPPPGPEWGDCFFAPAGRAGKTLRPLPKTGACEQRRTEANRKTPSGDIGNLLSAKRRIFQKNLENRQKTLATPGNVCYNHSRLRKAWAECHKRSAQAAICVDAGGCPSADRLTGFSAEYVRFLEPAKELRKQRDMYGAAFCGTDQCSTDFVMILSGRTVCKRFTDFVMRES